MQNVNCYLCGSNNYTVIFPNQSSGVKLEAKHLAARKGSINQEYSHNWVRCKNCGLVYANPIPDINTMQSLYISSDQGDYNQEIENIAHTYGKYLSKYRRFILDKRMALDIGAGRGFFLRTLLGFGFESVRGIEPSTLAYKCAPNDIKPFLINAVYDEKYFKPGTVDFISCFQTLEHVHHPDKMIESFSRLLSKNGIVYCIAHNFGTIAVKTLGTKHPIVNAGHLILFDIATLKRMFEKYFEVVDVFNISNRYSLRYWISILPLSEPIKKTLLKACVILGIDTVSLTMSVGNIGLIARKK